MLTYRLFFFIQLTYRLFIFVRFPLINKYKWPLFYLFRTYVMWLCYFILCKYGRCDFFLVNQKAQGPNKLRGDVISAYTQIFFFIRNLKSKNSLLKTREKEWIAFINNSCQVLYYFEVSRKRKRKQNVANSVWFVF